MLYSNLNTSNIEKVYGYKNSILAVITPENEADLWIITSKLGSQVNKNVEGYINSKLGGMTPEKGLDYLSGKK